MNKVIELSSKEISSVSGSVKEISSVSDIGFGDRDRVKISLLAISATILLCGISWLCINWHCLFYKPADSSPSKKANETP